MKIGILISGRGSNMVALVDAVASGEIPDSEVAVVISDKPGAAGLAKARERGVETVVIERNGRSREDHDADIVAELQGRGVDLVCLAGYMRLLSPSFIAAFPDQIINIHPSLLPDFPGLNVHERVLEAGSKVSGCTVHFVNEDLDAGEIIVQRRVEVLDDDTVETLAARILEKEHAQYIEAVRRVVVHRFPAISGVTNQDKGRLLLQILDIGIETSARGEGISLREALERADYRERRKWFNWTDLLPIILKNPFYVDEWLLFSEDKRTDGGWWIVDDLPGIGNLTTRERIVCDSMPQAVAQYVVRELDFWATLG